MVGWSMHIAHLSGNHFYFKKLFMNSILLSYFFMKKSRQMIVQPIIFLKNIFLSLYISNLIILLRKSDFLKDVQWLNMSHPYYRGANLKERAYTILA